MAGASSEESSDLWSESSEESSDDNAPVLLGLLASEHVHERRAVLRHLDEVDWSSTPPFRFRRALEQMAKRDADADVAAHAAAIVSVMPAASAQKTPRTMTPAVVDEDDDDDEEGAADAEDAPWSALRPVARMTIILAQIPPSLRSALARHVDVLVRSSGSTTAHTVRCFFFLALLARPHIFFRPLSHACPPPPLVLRASVSSSTSTPWESRRTPSTAAST